MSKSDQQMTPLSAGTMAGRKQRGEVRVAIVRDPRDFGILRDELWYRVPVDTAPKRWPPQWLAFYQTKVFRDEKWAINYYGRVKRISDASRDELFPHD